MFGVRRAVLIFVNAALVAVSWFFHGVPGADPYLPLFVIPLLFALFPYLFSLKNVSFLFGMNVAFFLLYASMKMLDRADVALLMLLMASSYVLSHFTMALNRDYKRYSEKKIAGEKDEYEKIVKELEVVENKARIVEKEELHISRLYEITKQLGPVLRFDELLDAVFDFLEDNFKLEKAHLLVFSGGDFSCGFSKGVAVSRGRDKDGQMDYNAVVSYAKKTDYAPFYLERQDNSDIFVSAKAASDTLLAFPLLFAGKLSAILAIEGANKICYDRLGIVVPQIALELRKVELYEQVEKLSIMDGLTGVYLRRYLVERLEEEVDRAKRLGMTFSIGMIDIDRFKECNDAHGHLVGDAVLKEIAERLKSSVREVDMVARYGGEEFCILLPETNKEFAVNVAERLRKAVESREIKAFDESMKMTVSAGVASYPKDGKSVDTLLEMADNALYKAKRTGRNRVVAA